MVVSPILSVRLATSLASVTVACIQLPRSVSFRHRLCALMPVDMESAGQFRRSSNRHLNYHDLPDLYPSRPPGDLLLRIRPQPRQSKDPSYNLPGLRLCFLSKFYPAISCEDYQGFRTHASGAFLATLFKRLFKLLWHVP